METDLHFGMRSPSGTYASERAVACAYRLARHFGYPLERRSLELYNMPPALLGPRSLAHLVDQIDTRLPAPPEPELQSLGRRLR